MEPITAYQTWTDLTKALIATHPQLGKARTRELEDLLLPAASIASWILAFEPGLSVLPKLRLTIWGPISHMADSGRWLNFVADFLGRPEMGVEVSWVTPSPCRDVNDPGVVLSSADVAARTHTVNAALVETLPQGSLIASGRLGIAAPEKASLCVLLDADLAEGHERWAYVEQISRPLDAGVPVALFSDSSIDHVFGRAVAEGWGYRASEVAYMNSWNSMGTGWLTMGNFGWALRGPRSAPQPHIFDDLETVFTQLADDIAEMGDEAFHQLCRKLPPRACGAAGPGARLVCLPYGFAVDLKTGEIFGVHDGKSNTLAGRPHAPIEALADYPGESEDNLLARCVWAAKFNSDQDL